MRPVKYVFLSASVLMLLVPNTSFAQDARCFTEQECIDRRTIDLPINATEAAEGFVQPAIVAEACGGTTQPKPNGQGIDKIGFCLPAGKTKTQINFGGRNEFANIADFIQFFYQYGLGIASVISVLVIIIAGLQWAISGGNTSSIQAAKKRISGAIIGLALLALSYTILNFVNPRTVELRLPEIWMINPAKLAPTYCQDSEENLNLAFFETQDNVDKLTATQTKDKFNAAKGTFSSDLAEFAKCGSVYFIEGGGSDRTCNGNYCETLNNQNYVCGAKRNEFFKDDCFPGDIILSTFSSGNAPGWEYPWIDEPIGLNSSVKIIGICASGKTFALDTSHRIYDSDMGTKRQHISVTFKNFSQITNKVNRECGGVKSDKFKGFVFGLDINENFDPLDEDHFIGRGGKDLGDNTAFEKIKTNPQVEPFLFTLDEIQNRKLSGQRIDIHAIRDIDNNDQLEAAGDEARYLYYKDLGFPNPNDSKTPPTPPLQIQPEGFGGAGRVMN